MAPQVESNPTYLDENTTAPSSLSSKSMSIELETQKTASPATTPAKTPMTSKAGKTEKGSLWWMNGVFVIIVHIVGILGPFFYIPTGSNGIAIMLLTIFLTFLATLGITAGYHRLWSHRSFKASNGLKIFLAILGTLGFQGSIKWWGQFSFFFFSFSFYFSFFFFSFFFFFFFFLFSFSFSFLSFFSLLFFLSFSFLFNFER